MKKKSDSINSDCEEYVLCCKYGPLGDVFAVGLGNGTIKVSSKVSWTDINVAQFSFSFFLL